MPKVFTFRPIDISNFTVFKNMLKPDKGPRLPGDETDEQIRQRMEDACSLLCDIKVALEDGGGSD